MVYNPSLILNPVNNVNDGSVESSELINTILLLPVKAFDSLVAYPVRLSIMNALIGGPLTVTDISAKLKLAKGVVHRHLKVLEKLGWVTVASDEMLKILELSREANRIYYVLSSLVYFGYEVEVNDHDIQLKINGDYVAFADSRREALIVKTPTMIYGCAKSCGNSFECLNWAFRTSKKFKVEINAHEVYNALTQLFYGLLIKSFTSPKARLPLIRIIDLKVDNMYRQWFGNPIRVNNGSGKAH